LNSIVIRFSSFPSSSSSSLFSHAFIQPQSAHFIGHKCVIEDIVTIKAIPFCIVKSYNYNAYKIILLADFSVFDSDIERVYYEGKLNNENWKWISNDAA
jgi:hypothetical protein